MALFLGKIPPLIHCRDVGGNGTEWKNMLALFKIAKAAQKHECSNFNPVRLTTFFVSSWETLFCFPKEGGEPFSWRSVSSRAFPILFSI